MESDSDGIVTVLTPSDTLEGNIVMPPTPPSAMDRQRTPSPLPTPTTTTAATTPPSPPPPPPYQPTTTPIMENSKHGNGNSSSSRSIIRRTSPALDVPSDIKAASTFGSTDDDATSRGTMSAFGSPSKPQYLVEINPNSKDGGSSALDMPTDPLDEDEDILLNRCCLVGTCWPKESYFYVFAVFGCTLRIYLGRFFGTDCHQDAHNNPDDVLAQWFTNICVTNTGKTEQTGGALFTDLPSNIIGSWIMGMLAPAVASGHILPWFSKDHRLQNHTHFHLALATSFCGSFTTFASWNTQMVVMLDGTRIALGSQVPAALCGYILGVMCAAAAFIFGRHCHDWFVASHSRPKVIHRNSDIEGAHNENHSAVNTTKKVLRRKVSRPRKWIAYVWDSFTFVFGINFGPFILAIALFAIYGFADAVWHEVFYREMWIANALAPVGAYARMRLAVLNDKTGPCKRLEWVPWGTLAANLIAVIVSVGAEAVTNRYVKNMDSSTSLHAWLNALLPAMETGFAGSLSTVSTLMKEMFSMKTTAQSYAYVFGSLTVAMLLGLLVYSAIVRH